MRSYPSIESMLLREKGSDPKNKHETPHCGIPAAPHQGVRRWEKKHPSEMLLETMNLLIVRHASKLNRGRRST
jgi:hypothetical protein